MSSYLFSCYIITRAEHPSVQNDSIHAIFAGTPCLCRKHLQHSTRRPINAHFQTVKKRTACHLAHSHPRSAVSLSRPHRLPKAAKVRGKFTGVVRSSSALSLSLSSVHHHHIHLIRSFNSLPKGTHALQTPVRSRSFPLTHSLGAHYRSVPFTPTRTAAAAAKRRL